MSSHQLCQLQSKLSKSSPQEMLRAETHLHGASFVTVTRRLASNLLWCHAVFTILTTSTALKRGSGLTTVAPSAVLPRRSPSRNNEFSEAVSVVELTRDVRAQLAPMSTSFHSELNRSQLVSVCTISCQLPQCVLCFAHDGTVSTPLSWSCSTLSLPNLFVECFDGHTSDVSLEVRMDLRAWNGTYATSKYLAAVLNMTCMCILSRRLIMN